jgi:hypothetical protein
MEINLTLNDGSHENENNDEVVYLDQTRITTHESDLARITHNEKDSISVSYLKSMDATAPVLPDSSDIILGRKEAYQLPQYYEIVPMNSKNNKTVLRSYGEICCDARLPDAIKFGFQCLATTFCQDKNKTTSMGVLGPDKKSTYGTSNAVKHLRNAHQIEGDVSVKMKNTKISLRNFKDDP